MLAVVCKAECGGLSPLLVVSDAEPCCQYKQGRESGVIWPRDIVLLSPPTFCASGYAKSRPACSSYTSGVRSLHCTQSCQARACKQVLLLLEEGRDELNKGHVLRGVNRYPDQLLPHSRRGVCSTAHEQVSIPAQPASSCYTAPASGSVSGPTATQRASVPGRLARDSARPVSCSSS